MLVFEAALLLSVGYLIWYGVFCAKRGRGGPAAGAFLLAILPGLLFVTLVCIS